MTYVHDVYIVRYIYERKGRLKAIIPKKRDGWSKVEYKTTSMYYMYIE